MRFITTAAITSAVIGAAGAMLMETDILAAAGLAKLGLHVAINGYPNPEQCTLENVSVRREWCVERECIKISANITTGPS